MSPTVGVSHTLSFQGGKLCAGANIIAFFMLLGKIWRRKLYMDLFIYFVYQGLLVRPILLLALSKVPFSA